MKAIQQKKSQRRRTILNAVEQQLYYCRPLFDDEAREIVFMLNNEEKTFIKTFSPRVALYTILQLAYFKTKQQFFNVTYQDVHQDLHWIQQTHFPEETSKKLPSRNIRDTVKNKIAIFMGYEKNTARITAYLVEQAAFLAKQTNDPNILFKELFLCLKQNKMVLPAYTTLQDIISQAAVQEETRLLQCLEQRLTPTIKDQLDILLGNEDELNKIRDLKKDLSGFNYSAMKQEIALHQANQSLYQFAKGLLPDFQISEQNVHYYAECIHYYSTYELNQLLLFNRYLYLLCYIYHRHQKMDNNLIQAFTYHVDKIKKAGGSHASAVFSKQQKILFADPKAISLLIGNYANNTLLKSRKTFNAVAKNAYKIISKKAIAELAEQIHNQSHYQTTAEGQYYQEHRQLIELNLRPILEALTFQADKNDNALLEAVTFLKNVFSKGTSITKVPSSQFPQKAIQKKFKAVVFDSKRKVKPYYYEFLIYTKLRDHIAKNIVYVNDSIEYKSFREDVKSNFVDKDDKEKFLIQLNKPKLLKPIKNRLLELEKDVEALFVEVNKNIANGTNKCVRVKTVNGETTWSLHYPGAEKEFNHKFYEQLPMTNISDVFDFVNDECDFIREINHFRVKDVKKDINYQATKGGIIGEATRQGIVQMALRSNLDLDILRRNKKNYIRESSIRKACRKIIKK